MKRKLQRIATLVLGWTLILLGVIGLFLPLLQGVLLIALGTYVLSRESEIAQRWYSNFLQRHPGLHARLERAKRRMPWHRESQDDQRGEEP
ncbi:MAG: hypothetical protein GY906_25215 [bacterium]|nr:hypothetical protein [bacterium]